MRRIKLFALLMAGICAFAFADEVKLNDGSILIGEVQGILDGKVTIKTAFAGDLAIAMANVTSIKAEKAMNVKIEGKGNATATFNGDNFSADGETYPLTTAQLTATWPENQPDPTLPPPPQGRKWKFYASAAVTGKDGNVRKCASDFEFIATLTGRYDLLKLYAKWSESKEATGGTEKHGIAGADYSHRIMESSVEWYARAEAEYNNFGDMDPKITLAAGIGKYWIDTDDIKVRTRLGLTAIHHEYISHDRDDIDTMGLEANYHHDIKIHDILFVKNLGDFITDVTYSPQFNDIHYYRIYHESSLTMPLSGSKNLNLKLGVSNDYYGRVARGREHLDTIYFAKIVIEWE